MHRTRRITLTATRAGFALAVLAFSACDSGTEPERTAPIKVIHAAPGAGTFDVRINGRALGTIGAGAGVADTAVAGEQDIELVGGVLHLRVLEDVADGNALGVVLMDAAEPTLLTYPNTRFGSGVRLHVINAVMGASLNVVLDGRASMASLAGIEYQESSVIGMAGGFHDVSAFLTGTADTMDLGRVFLPTGRVFLVVYPNPGGTVPWSVVAL